MRIALVHSFYRSDAPSGENVVVQRQAEALRVAGHEVLVIGRYSDDQVKTLGFAAKSAFTVATGLGADPLDELRRFNPDVVHVHNLFPNFGERWLQHWEGLLVTTLHNFRPVCANGLLFRDGATCTACKDGNTLPGLRHGCYRGSRIATLPLAIHNAGGLRRNKLVARADRVIVLSEHFRQVLAENVSPSLAAKMVVIPNGVEDRAGPEARERTLWSFVGRLTAEKGIRELIEVWPEGERLVVVGDGPLQPELVALAHPNVAFTGHLGQSGVDEVLSSSLGLIFPSRCFEGFPTVIAEALMHSTPVVANDGNGGADFIAATKAGVVYHTRIALALSEVREAGHELRMRARTAYDEHLTIQSWATSLSRVYGYGAAGVSD